MKKSIFASKTFWFGVAQWAVAASAWLGTSPGFPATLAPYFGATGMITIVLRMVTSTAVSFTGSAPTTTTK